MTTQMLPGAMQKTSVGRKLGRSSTSTEQVTSAIINSFFILLLNAFTHNFRSNIYLDIRGKNKNLSQLLFLVADLKQNGLMTEKTIVFVNTPDEVGVVFYYLWQKLDENKCTEDISTGAAYIAAFFASSGESKKVVQTKFTRADSPIRILV